MLEKEGPSTIILAMQKENSGKIALVKNKKKKWRGNSMSLMILHLKQLKSGLMKQN